MNLNSEIKDLGKIASQIAPKLKQLGITTINDLLFYFPFRYEDYSRLLKIKDLLPNSLVTVKGKIELLNSRRSWKRRMLITEAIISDETASIKSVWFNQRFLTKILQTGDLIYLSGKVTMNEAGLEFVNPTYEKIAKNSNFNAHTNRIVPIYSTTERLSQKQIRFLIKKVLPLAQSIGEWLPAETIKNAKLLPLKVALDQIHFPKNFPSLEQARHRLKFDEIFILQTRALFAKKELQHFKAPKIEFKETATKDFVSHLPFKLTNSQRKSAWEIIKELARHEPMNRLLEGDVGSGKTVTVAIAIINVLLNNYQVAYMAPTEILANQHFNSFVNIFKKYPFTIGLLTGANAKIALPQTNNQIPTIKEIKKNELVKLLSAGKIHFIIGTHALIQQKIHFQTLALAVVDEQHRFGVQQRKLIKEKNAPNADSPHFLSMTATPIPRSLALTLYGDLNLSIIDEQPKDRKPIITKVVSPHEREEAYDFLRTEIKKGRQVFIICPLIDLSDKLGVKAVTEEFTKLDKKIFAELPVALLHGRLKSEEKEKIMADFAANKIKILVATSVIEVGIDVPNASVMMIESAERFGLSQLHQLRGRVGRAEHQSYCLLFTESENELTVKRMQAFVSAKNGFELSEKDLEFRGPGEVYGIRQSGFYDSLKIAKLTDWPVIKAAKTEVEKIMAQDPNLKTFPLIKEKVKTFEASIHLE